MGKKLEDVRPTESLDTIYQDRSKTENCIAEDV